MSWMTSPSVASFAPTYAYSTLALPAHTSLASIPSQGVPSCHKDHLAPTGRSDPYRDILDYISRLTEDLNTAASATATALSIEKVVVEGCPVEDLLSSELSSRVKDALWKALHHPEVTKLLESNGFPGDTGEEGEPEQPAGLNHVTWQAFMIALRQEAPDIWRALLQKTSRAHVVKSLDYGRDKAPADIARDSGESTHDGPFVVKRMTGNGMVGLAIAIPVGLSFLGIILIVVAYKHRRQQERIAAQRWNDGGERGIQPRQRAG